MAMASLLCTPMLIDDRTLDISIGQFARVLVEIDLSHDREEVIMVERLGHCAFAVVRFENLPRFCKSCGVIGHLTEACTKLQHKTAASVQKKIWVEKTKGQQTSSTCEVGSDSLKTGHAGDSNPMVTVTAQVSRKDDVLPDEIRAEATNLITVGGTAGAPPLVSYRD